MATVRALKLQGGAELKQLYIERIRIETVIEDDQKDAVLACLKSTAEKGDLGTLKAFVTPVVDALRVPNS